MRHTEPKRFHTFDDEYYSPRSIAERGINTTTQEEYEPGWVKVRPPFTMQKLRGAGAPIAVHEIAAKTARQEFIVSAPADTEVEASTFYYPGWTITVDGKSVPTAPASDSGTMFFHLPRGEHRVVIELLPTALRYFALIGTIATAAFLFLAVAAARLRPSRLRLAMAQHQAEAARFPAGERSVPYRVRHAAAFLVFLATVAGLAVAVDRGRLLLRETRSVPALPQRESEDALIKAGLDALYTRNDPNAAIVQFRRVLERNSTHYGATYQLAAALDRAGKPAETRPLWERMLRMAEQSNDQETLKTVRERLARRDR